MNNFDQSSSGVNLELNISYDLDRAQRDFNESFVKLDNGGLVFTQYGNFDLVGFSLTDLDNYDLSDCTVKSLFKAYYNFKYPTNIDADLRATDYQGIKDLLQDLQIEKLNDLDIQELFEAIETDLYCDNDFVQFLNDNFTANYETIISRGYCQGDQTTVIIPAVVINEYTGKTADQVTELLSDPIDHLLWDQPLYSRLTIDEEEFYIDEHLKNEYNYDQAEIINILNDHLEHDQKEYIVKWVADNLPTDPKCY